MLRFNIATVYGCVNHAIFFKIMVVTNAIDALVKLPSKYFSAKLLSSGCLYRAMLFAANTNPPMAPN